MKINQRFAIFAWVALALNLFVIVWGAFVRATGSGAGCGSHWPLCNGEVIPRPESMEMIIEFSHRVTAGIALLVVLGLLVWAWRLYGPGHAVWWAALWSMVLMLVEAAVGAGLVLLEYVATNVSVARAYWMAGHLMNTFFLLAALVLTAWWASGGALPGRWREQGGVRWFLLAALVGMLILGASGGVTALGDTLVLAGVESPLVLQLKSLRIYHPLIAFAVGGLVVLACAAALRHRPGEETKRWVRLLVAVFVLQLLAGALNVALKAPVWMQLVHLLLADLLWMGLVLLTSETLARRPAETSSSQAAPLARERLA